MTKINPEDVKAALIAKRALVDSLEDILHPYKGIPDEKLPASVEYLRKELKTNERILDALFAEYMGETVSSGPRRRIVLGAIAEMLQQRKVK